MFRQLFISTPFALGLALVACGGDVPSTGQIKADFESPSGSTKSKQTVAGAYTKNEASASGASLAGSFSPGLGGLTQAGSGQLRKVGIGSMMAPHLARLQARLNGQSTQALGADVDFAACVNNDEITQELTASLASGSTSGSFDVDIDLGSCSAGKMTGKLAMSGSFDIDSDSFTFEVNQTLTNVCETEGNKYCVTGDYVMEATMTAGDSKMEMVVGWYITASWQEDGAAKTLVTKGGIRMGFGGETGLGSAEYLIYVNDENGEEVSLVLKISSTAEGASYEIRGEDGSLTCQIKNDGSGSCGGDLSWDEAYIDSLEADASFSGKE